VDKDMQALLRNILDIVFVIKIISIDDKIVYCEH
jgi:hypothetical protein